MVNLTGLLLRSILKTRNAYSFIMIGKGVVIISNSIFIGKDLNIGDNDLAYLCEYVPVNSRIGHDDRSKHFVLGFKDGYQTCLQAACDMIVPNLGYDFCIAVVPPSKRNRNYITPCHGLAGMILNRIGTSHRITNATRVLKRTNDIPSLHMGGNRSLQTHDGSIEVDNPELIKGRDVLLLDDIYTTGNSVQACVNRLKDKGARSVTSLVIAKTLDIYHGIKYGLIFDLDQTLYDTSAIKPYRDNRNWAKAMEMAETIKYNPYNGVPQLLNWIKNNPQALDVCMVTSAPSGYANIFANALGITKVVAYHDTKTHKPSIEPYCKAKQLLGIYEKFITVVGDNTNDIIPGLKLSMNTVLIAPQHDGISNWHFTSFEDFVENIIKVVWRY